MIMTILLTCNSKVAVINPILADAVDILKITKSTVGIWNRLINPEAVERLSISSGLEITLVISSGDSGFTFGANKNKFTPEASNKLPTMTYISVYPIA